MAGSQANVSYPLPYGVSGDLQQVGGRIPLSSATLWSLCAAAARAVGGLSASSQWSGNLRLHNCMPVLLGSNLDTYGCLSGH